MAKPTQTTGRPQPKTTAPVKPGNRPAPREVEAAEEEQVEEDNADDAETEAEAEAADTGEDEAGASDTGPRTITAKRTSGESVSVSYEFGDDIDQMIEKFGDKVVFNHARGSLTVALQGWLRLQLDNKKTPAEIKAAVKDWKPGIRRQGKSPIEKMRAQLGAMSAEDRAALLKELKA